MFVYVNADVGAGGCERGLFGMGRTVPGEYGGVGGHVGRMSVAWSGYVYRLGYVGGVRRQVSPVSVCNFETELWRAEQGVCDQMHLGVLGWVGAPGGDE